MLTVQPSNINDHLFYFIPKDAISIIFLLASKSIGAIVFVSKQWNQYAIELFTPHISSKLRHSIQHIQQIIIFPALLSEECQIPPPKGLSELRSAITAIMQTQTEHLRTVPVDDMPSLLNAVEIGDPGFAFEMVAAAQVLQRSIIERKDLLLLHSLSPNFLAKKLLYEYISFPHQGVSSSEIISYMEDLCSKGHYQRAFALIPSYAKEHPDMCSKIVNMAHQGGDVELAYTYYVHAYDPFPHYLFTKISTLAHTLQRFDILFSLFQNRNPQAVIELGTPRNIFLEEMAKAGVPHLAIAFVQKFFPPSRIANCMKAVARSAVDHNYCDELFQALLSMTPPENYYSHFFLPVARVFAYKGKWELAVIMASKYPEDEPKRDTIYVNLALNANDNRHTDRYEWALHSIKDAKLKSKTSKYANYEPIIMREIEFPPY